MSPTVPPATTAPRAPEPFRKDLPDIPETVSIAEHGLLRQQARVAGRDGGQSASLGGKSVWIFADTTLKEPWGFLSNSAAVTADLDASDGIDLRTSNGFDLSSTAVPSELIPRTQAELDFEKAHRAPAGGCATSSDEHCGAIFGFWPGPVVADEQRGRVLFTYGKLCRGGRDGTFCSGSLGKHLGTGIASLDMTTGRVTRLTMSGAATVRSVEGADPTLTFADGDRATAGSGAALAVGDYAYLYGQCDYFDCAVARAPLAKITDRSQWRYYDGATFGADHTAAKKVGVQPGSGGHTVFYNAAIRAYVDVYMTYGGGEVWYRVGGSPMGPWSDGTKLTTTKNNKDKPNYSLYGHPEFAEKDGLVQYLSYFNGDTGEQHLLRWEMRP